MNKSLIAAAVLLVLAFGIGWFVWGSHPSPSSESAPSAELEPVSVSITYKQNEPYTPQLIAVKQGQHVSVHVLSDVADEVHFHGYDLHTDVEANQEGTLEFDATQTGRFEMELESLGQTLAVIEVYPN